MKNKIAIRRFATGVPGLDEILGGGLPEYSLNLIVGPPGSGKTTLAHQIMFALATPERPALFISILGEPSLKMLRYQQQFAFFDHEKIDSSIRFVDLSADIESGGLDRVLTRIGQELAASSPALVFVDSFRAATWAAQHRPGDAFGIQDFIQKLGILLSGWQATTFLIGKDIAETPLHPIFTIADGLLSLEQSVYRNSMVRKIQVMKMRGQATRPGLHTFRITRAGIRIFAAALAPEDSGALAARDDTQRDRVLLTMGNPVLDAMLGGGLPAGYSMLVAGPSGSGKTILATAFLAEGVRRGEAGVMVAFEQTPSQSHTRTIDDLVRAGKIGLINTRALDLSIEEVVQRLVEMIDKKQARRVVIDSLSGFELAVAPGFREDFRESLFRLVAVLSGLDVAVLLTCELEDRYTDLRFSPYGSAFLTDAIVVQRYIELESNLKRVMAVIKMRARNHSKEIRQYDIDDTGINIGAQVLGYAGLFSGRPTRELPPATVDKQP
jgi:circadian clock protein KaiC